MHLSDLHIGKRVNERSMLEEQRHILEQICCILDDQQPDAVIIAGDIYDKQVPSAEAVTLFDDFLVKLSRRDCKTLIISGNHDSAERNAFASRIISGSGIYIASPYSGEMEKVTLEDEYGQVCFHMMPYMRNIQAAEELVRGTGTDGAARNVMIAHQFVTGAMKCESEDISVGGLDNIDASVFSDFDYVALGHLHRPQDCGSERIRYCGSPLKYSFSEVNDMKSVTIVTLRKKGELVREFIPLVPLHDWHDLKGSYEELVSLDFYSGTPYQEDFVRITLTDEDDVPDAVGKLRTVYHNMMEIRYDNTRTRAGLRIMEKAADVEEKTPLELFGALYESQNGTEMNDIQKEFLKNLLNRIS